VLRPLAVVVALSIASPAAAERACVAIAKGTKLYAKKGKRPVGKTTDELAVDADLRKGAWLRVSRELVEPADGGGSLPAGSVSFWVRRRDTAAAGCPATSTIGLLTTADHFAALRWSDGTLAGEVTHHWILEEVRCGRKKRLAGEEHRCFPWSPVAGLAVTICAVARPGATLLVEPLPCD
jgi:hypothetical protein